jgi:hypothetical protein
MLQDMIADISVGADAARLLVWRPQPGVQVFSGYGYEYPVRKYLRTRA